MVKGIISLLKNFFFRMYYILIYFAYVDDTVVRANGDKLLLIEMK